jgi:hypothetical protein
MGERIMDTKELVTVEVVPHSGAVIVTALLNPYDGYGAYFKSMTYYFSTVNESIELFVDQFGSQIVRD